MAFRKEGLKNSTSSAEEWVVVRLFCEKDGTVGISPLTRNWWGIVSGVIVVTRMGYCRENIVGEVYYDGSTFEFERY